MALSATIVSSDGGEDTVISNEQANDIALDKISSYSAMHVSNFVSMIQERKTIKKNKTGKPEKDQLDLFTLPEINIVKVSAKMRNTKDISPTSHNFINETPVIHGLPVTLQETRLDPPITLSS